MYIYICIYIYAHRANVATTRRCSRRAHPRCLRNTRRVTGGRTRRAGQILLRRRVLWRESQECAEVSEQSCLYDKEGIIHVWYGVTTISRLLKSSVSFAKEPYKRDYILQKRLIISSSPLIVSTPYPFVASICVVHVSLTVMCVIHMCYVYGGSVGEFSNSLVSMTKKASFTCWTYIRSFHMFRSYVSLTVMRVMNMCYTYGGSLLEFLNSLVFMTKRYHSCVTYTCIFHMCRSYVSLTLMCVKHVCILFWRESQGSKGKDTFY